MTQPPAGMHHPWDDPAGYRPGQPDMPPPVPYTGPPVLFTAPAEAEPPWPGVSSDVAEASERGGRQDLLNATVGEHGVLAGSGWADRAERPTPFVVLITLELRGLADTLSGRILLALSPVSLVLATWYLSSDAILTAAPTTAAVQVFGLIVACQVGPVPAYAAVLTAFACGWHRGGVHSTFLLQPRRQRHALPQLAAVLALWLAMTSIQFILYYWLRSVHTRSGQFHDYVGSRPLWVLAVALLSGFLTLLFLLCIAFLVRNPRTAVTAYLVLSAFFLIRVVNPPVLRYLDPWQPASLLAGEIHDPLPAITSGVALVAMVTWGCVQFARRHGLAEGRGRVTPPAD